MRNDRHLAVTLRKKGYSDRAISTELGIPKTTLSSWFGGRPWSERIRRKLFAENCKPTEKAIRAMVRAQRAKWEAWRKEFRDRARRDFPRLVRDPLFIPGMMLYWGEGDSKTRSQVRIANTDPRMLRLFVRFLRRSCGVPPSKIVCRLILYPDLEARQENAFWSKRLRVPIGQFRRAQVIRSRTCGGLHPSKRLSHGVCTVDVTSTGLKEQFRVWQNLCYRYLVESRLRA